MEKIQIVQARTWEGAARTSGAAPLEADPPVSLVSSTKEFQLPQSGHFPCHLGDSLPHWVQTKTVFTLLFTAAIKPFPLLLP